MRGAVLGLGRGLQTRGGGGTLGTPATRAAVEAHHAGGRGVYGLGVPHLRQREGGMRRGHMQARPHTPGGSTRPTLDQRVTILGLHTCLRHCRWKRVRGGGGGGGQWGSAAVVSCRALAPGGAAQHLLCTVLGRQHLYLPGAGLAAALTRAARGFRRSGAGAGRAGRVSCGRTPGGGVCAPPADLRSSAPRGPVRHSRRCRGAAGPERSGHRLAQF